MAQGEAAAGIDLMKAFTNYQDFKDLLRKLVIPTDQVPVDPTASILILQALFDIEKKVKRKQFETDELYGILKNILRKWRCESPLGGAYSFSSRFNTVPKVLKSLSIFETFGVPLFIDNYGTKQRLSDYNDTEPILDIHGHGDQPIHHVTHNEEAKSILRDRRFQPSDNKNIIPGCWFGLPAEDSWYGTYVFETALSKLGVKGLCQGEIVSYKNEVNVILYAVDDDGAKFVGLRKPTLGAVKEKHGNNAYVHVSIFVPSRFLPEADQFTKVVSDDQVYIHRHTMCVREKRTDYECQEQKDVNNKVGLNSSLK